MKKIAIISAIAGSLITIFCFHAYFFYQLRSETIKNTIDIKSIVDFINQGIKEAEAVKQAEPTPAPVTPKK